MGTAAFAYIGYDLATLGPEVAGRLFTNMIIGAGMVEALGLIGFVMPLIVK